MSDVAIARSSFQTSLTRYSYSWGLWVLLLIAPISARFMIAEDDGFGMQVSIGGHLPVMTSATLGVTLGIIVSTLLLPIGFLYLRSNVTRIQPWQIEEVTAASRVAITLGRFAADVAILFAILSALTLAGWFLGWMVGSGPLNVLHITFALWVVAGPSLMCLAAIRILLDSVKLTRGGLGDTAFFIIWLTAIAMPAVSSALPSSYSANMIDMTGFLRPLSGPERVAMGSFTIGFSDILPGRVPLDAMAGIFAPGYLAARLSWAAIAIAVAAFAGLLYRPHIASRKVGLFARLARQSAARPPKPANPAAPPAGFASSAFINLTKAEFRLIGQGRLFLILAAVAAALGTIADYRQLGSPAAMLLMAFALSAHAGRSESLRTLTNTLVTSPAIRRIGFVVAGTGWALLLALPGAVAHVSGQPLLLALATGTVASTIAIGLATVSRSAFAPRLVLLVLWYGYFSTGG